MIEVLKPVYCRCCRKNIAYFTSGGDRDRFVKDVNTRASKGMIIKKNMVGMLQLPEDKCTVTRVKNHIVIKIEKRGDRE